MAFQGKKSNLSIDVHNNRPTPLNMLMQQSMEVLTKMVTRKLQDTGKIPHSNGPIQISFESKGLPTAVNKSNGHTPSELAIDDLSLDGDSEKEIIDIENESNYHMCSSETRKLNSEIPSGMGQRDLELDRVVDDSELNLGEDEGDIIFDYGTQEITGSPDEIGEHISQMLESALPNGFEHDGQGRLHAVVNGDELTITEQEFAEAMSSLQKIQTIKHRKQQKKPQGNIETISENDPVEVKAENPGGPVQGKESDLSETEKVSRSRPPSHNHMYGPDGTVSSTRTRRRHDFDYPVSSSARLPNFGSLLSEKSPLCLFCEYYMVFGEPPRNMIKWYNKTYEHDSLSRKKDSRHNHHRKRNR